MKKKNIEKIKMITKLTLIANERGCDLNLTINELGLEIVDLSQKEYATITPHWTGSIYFGKEWANELDEMLDGTIKALEVLIDG